MLTLPYRPYSDLLLYLVIGTCIVLFDVFVLKGKAGPIKRSIVFFEIALVLWGFSGFLSDYMKDISTAAAQATQSGSRDLVSRQYIMGKEGRSVAMIFGTVNCLFYAFVFFLFQGAFSGLSIGFKKLWKAL